MLIAELLNKKIDYEVKRATTEMFQTQAEIGGRIIKFFGEKIDVEENGEVWEVEFAEHKNDEDRRGTYKLSGSGNELEVFSMIKDSIIEMISRYHPYKIKFTADKANGKNNRGNTYERLLKRFKMPGYTYERREDNEGMMSYDKFILVKNH